MFRRLSCRSGSLFCLQPDCSPHTDSASACGGSGFVLDNHASLRGLMSNLELLRAWDLFVDATLRPILEHQIGSSNVYPSSAMDFANYPAAQGDEMKLGVDFDAYRLDEDDDEDDDDFVMRAENRVQPQQHEGGAPAAQYDVWGDEIPEVCVAVSWQCCSVSDLCFRSMRSRCTAERSSLRTDPPAKTSQWAKMRSTSPASRTSSPSTWPRSRSAATSRQPATTRYRPSPTSPTARTSRLFRRATMSLQRSTPMRGRSD